MPVYQMQPDSHDYLRQIEQQKEYILELEGRIKNARALATLNGQRPDGRSEQGWIGVVSAVALLAILDGEEQS